MASGHAATKGALIAVVGATALDLGKETIHLYAIFLGLVDTLMLRASAARRSHDNPANAISESGKRRPVERVLTAEEVADVIIFLGRSLSSGIIGAAIRVDGRLTVRLAL